MLQEDLKPRDIVTRQSFENAMVLITTLGGSTNAVLHLIAMAQAFDIELTIDDFLAVSNSKTCITTDPRAPYCTGSLILAHCCTYGTVVPGSRTQVARSHKLID